jgi:hypothetical protein
MDQCFTLFYFFPRPSSYTTPHKYIQHILLYCSHRLHTILLNYTPHDYQTKENGLDDKKIQINLNNLQSYCQFISSIYCLEANSYKKIV